MNAARGRTRIRRSAPCEPWVAQTNTAGNYRIHGYDASEQLTAAHGFEADGLARPHEQWDYGYDAAGNLAHRTNNALRQDFRVNAVNQLTNVSRTGTLTVAGYTSGTAQEVRVNDLAATVFADHTFARAGFSPADGANTYTATATSPFGHQDTNHITVQLPLSVTNTYDLNGNLLSDGRRGFQYDDENQLVSVTETNAWRSEFAYDFHGRLRIRKEFTWTSGLWSLSSEVRYLYDGIKGS